LNRSKIAFLLLAIVLVGALLSREALKSRPLTLFLLGGGDPPSAFRVQADLGSGRTQLEPIRLDRNSARQAREILQKGETGALRALADGLGEFQGVLALQGPEWEKALPGVLGGGWSSFRFRRSDLCFSDLGPLDRMFLSLFLKTPETQGAVQGDLVVDILSGVRPTPTLGLPTQGKDVPSQGPLRVEIQNGCGIKGAADWAARRLEGPTLKVVGTGNAPNFRFPTSLVRSSVGRPVALEEALERLGLPPEALEEVPTLVGTLLTGSQASQAVDVIVIIGRDFRRLQATAKKDR
jgi:hypothetical protein